MTQVWMSLSKSCPTDLIDMVGHWINDPPEIAIGHADRAISNTNPNIKMIGISRAHGKWLGRMVKLWIRLFVV